jgi:ribonuclease-3
MMMSDASAPREVLIRQFQQAYGLEALTPARIDLALTHRSYANETGSSDDNERLEFLGDAVLAAASSAWLYHHFGEDDEGSLSKVRSHIVSRSMLGKRAKEMDIGPMLLLGRSEGNSGGRQRRSLLGSALEAVVGVLFLDAGYEAAARFVEAHIVQPSLEEIETGEWQGDFKSELQEWTQARSGATPEYRMVEESGPDHRKTFIVEVDIDGRAVARGAGTRIKTAENDAARLALMELKRDEPA